MFIPTDREEAMKAVLEQRMSALRKVIKNTSGAYKPYYEGKLEGLQQAHDLIGDTLESMCVELGEEPPVW